MKKIAIAGIGGVGGNMGGYLAKGGQDVYHNHIKIKRRDYYE